MPGASTAAAADDQRFHHLLAPLRDLAKNWNIDIATDLEEYLEELDKVTISFEGGQKNLNFAGAALLIQGTACIYSRKVGDPLVIYAIYPCVNPGLIRLCRLSTSTTWSTRPSNTCHSRSKRDR